MTDRNESHAWKRDDPELWDLLEVDAAPEALPDDFVSRCVATARSAALRPGPWVRVAIGTGVIAAGLLLWWGTSRQGRDTDPGPADRTLTTPDSVIEDVIDRLEGLTDLDILSLDLEGAETVGDDFFGS
ncbi:MAG TPA: hypothetical protein ENK43_05215 [Planctomycetes bacterium]|nr:hypothetical protein [Planctomycetota bacterium]